MNNRSVRLLLLFALFLSFTACSGAPFNFDAYDYNLHSLTLGMAFPPVQQEADVNKTIAICNELNIGWVRIQEAWPNREPAQDSFSWGPMDTRISLLHNAGIKILLTLSGHEWPAWLNSTAGHDEPATLAQFREYVAALLARYAGKIDRIQFGNEWNWEIDDYMAGDEEAFIAYANILYEEVYKLASSLRPTVVLGSLNGLVYIAADQGLVTRVVILNREPYQERVAAYLAAPTRLLSTRASNVLSNAQYDMLDIHMYDDWGNWPFYLQAIRALETHIGKTNTPVVLSEFGGPYPIDLYDFFGGKPSPDILAASIPDYLHTLDTMDLEEVYFFAPTEDPSRYHPDSFLINAAGTEMPSYEVMRRFGAANP